MFGLFRFDLPQAVTNQLVLDLNDLEGSSLTPNALADLRAFQERHEAQHGVYLLLDNDHPVYIGKADNVAERLLQHYEKLRGRLNVDLATINYKALILEVTWSTSANEDLLIEYFKSKDQCEWNKKGFGPKDPGKERDGHKPGWFDSTYPINSSWPCENIPDRINVGGALGLLKDQLPYLLRYSVDAPESKIELDLSGVPRTAESILVNVAGALGAQWQLMQFNSHFTLYKHDRPKQYSNGKQLHPNS